MRKRNIQISVRVNEEELEILDEKVLKSGLNREKFLRQLILGYQPKEKPDREFYNFIRTLSAIGNRINQIAAKANTLNFVDEREFRKEAEELAKLKFALQEKYLLPEREE